jgi:hypothetical protein
MSASLKVGAEPILAYRVGNYYTFELPDAEQSPVGLVEVTLAPGAWLERSAAGGLVICTPTYRFGAQLMAALPLGFCRVSELELEAEISDDEADDEHPGHPVWARGSDRRSRGTAPQ